MNNYKFDLVMDGSSFQQIQIPTGYKYFTVYNYTDNVIEVYQEHRTNSDSRAQLVKIPQYQAQTVPIEAGRNNISFIYSDGGGAGRKIANFIFSVENLQVNSTLGTAIAGTVTIGADGVGLLHTSDLDLDVSGKLGVNVAALPELPAGTNNIGSVDVAALPELPAGTNNIGSVDVAALPDVQLAAKTAVKVTAAGAGDQTVKAVPGRVYGISVVGAIDVILKDGTNDIWLNGFNGYHPIYCLTSIVLNFSGAGVAYIIYE